MDLVHFRDLQIEGLAGWTVFVDYEGTVALPGKEEADEQSLSKLQQLIKQGNAVYLCTNKKTIDPRIGQAGVIVIALSCAKPSVGDELRKIITGNEGGCLMIGDSLMRDGGLAKRLQIPFMPVLSLGKANKDPFPVSFGLPAPFYRDERKKICVIMPHAGFLSRFLPAKGYARQFQRYAEEVIAALKERGVAVAINPPLHQVEGPVLLLGDASKVAAIVSAKKRGYCTKIVAGPGLCETVNQARELLERSEIDEIVLTSQAQKDQWAAADQYFNKVQVIASPTKDVGQRCVSARSQGPIVVFADNANERVFKEAMKVLWQKKMSIVVSKAALFGEHRYASLLKNARAVLLLTQEKDLGRLRSQAWMADVPTLCWKSENQDAVPEVCGRSFVGEVDFESALDLFIKEESKYTPRAYALTHVAPEIVAGALLQLLR